MSSRTCTTLSANKARPLSPSCWRSWRELIPLRSMTWFVSAWGLNRSGDFARHGARVDVEINPAVVKVAARFFDFQPDQVALSIDDGRHFLNRCRKKYDVVILDAFLGHSSPSHLMTRVRPLAPSPASCALVEPLVINVLAHLEPGREFFAASLEENIERSLPGCATAQQWVGRSRLFSRPRWTVRTRNFYIHQISRACTRMRWVAQRPRSSAGSRLHPNTGRVR